ncbi:MAG TPA: amidase [Candidatus Binataceae bacterium]|nr:amidase [Candidatus Binataceae bacterium]
MLNPYIEGWELRGLVLKKEIRPREVAEFFLARVERLNPSLGAFMTITAERAMDDAARLEKMRPAEARKHPLFGIPYSIKDLVWTKDIRTTYGSKNFENYFPPADAELTVRLRNSGGILLGKTTTPEFGARPTTEGGLCPPARNPWNLAHTAGGSSGGAASAVAAGMHPIAQGSDGGGSIRIPAACCGVVGLKPSRGRITFAPEKAESWAGFSTTGPITRTVRDAAMMLDAIAGAVPGDPYAAMPPKRPFIDALRPPRRKLKLAAFSESKLGRLDDETRKAFASACRAFREMGHSVEHIDIDPSSRLNEYIRVIIAAGVGSWKVENPDLMDPAVRGTWEAGRRIMAADYIAAVTGMHNAARQIVQELMPYDATLAPVLTRPAVPVGSLPSNPETAAEEIYAWIPFTAPLNATGQPAIALPNGFAKSGLPLAFQIIGRQNDEATIISLAAQFEKARPWRDKHPPID